MSSGRSLEIVAVPPMPQQEAIMLFARWLESNPELAKSLKPEDIQVDVIRAEGGASHRRYRVRLQFAPARGTVPGPEPTGKAEDGPKGGGK